MLCETNIIWETCEVSKSTGNKHTRVFWTSDPFCKMFAYASDRNSLVSAPSVLFSGY